MTDNTIRLSKKRLAALISLFACFCFVFVFFIIYSTGVIKGVNADIDEKRHETQADIITKITTEGTITDRFGLPITQTAGPGSPAVITDPEAFSSIVGYNSRTYRQSGLRSVLFDDLFNGGKDMIGANVKLTLDSQLQKQFYDLLYGHVGSATAINVDTGEIVATASRSDPYIGYIANGIGEVREDGLTNFQYYNSIPEFWFDKATFNNDTGGSTNKVITTACAIENGRTNFVYDDVGEFSIGGGTIRNADDRTYGTCDLQRALSNSVNTYFANLGLELGSIALQATAEKYLINKPIELDYTTLYSDMTFKGENKEYILASTGYGQGEQTISPMHLAMIMQAIMNDGKMIRPYLIQSTDNDGKHTELHKKTEVISETILPDNNAILREYLYQTALANGFDANDGWVIAKTGTAQNGSNDLNHVYLAFAVRFSSGMRFACCLDYSQTRDMYGRDLVPTAKKMIDYLFGYANRELSSHQESAGS